MADVTATGGFNATKVVFTANTERGRQWLQYRGGDFTIELVWPKTRAGEAFTDCKLFGLTVEQVG